MKNGKIDKYLFEGGYAQATSTGAYTDSFAFNYYNQDHLGNNREVVDASGSIVQVTNYYPFGTPYADASAVKGATLQQYKYNGKELDTMHGLNSYDYGARQYNPVTARWDRIDPLCEKYYGVSPYNYCHNNPVMLVDPDGMDDHYTENGKFLKRVDNGTNNVIVNDKQLQMNGQVVTTEQFQAMASTVYGESSVAYGITNKKEMYAIASVHIKNRKNKAFGNNSKAAKKFRSTELSKQNEGMQMANGAIINALNGGIDYSHGANQWDGAEQAMLPKGNEDIASNGKFMYKINTMGWSISDEDFKSWENAINNKFGEGKFNVPQKKQATTNYRGMKNQGKIRLSSTAQYGLTIFWKEK